MGLLYAFLKTLWSLIPYLRERHFCRSYKEDFNDSELIANVSPVHEELAYLISSIDISDIRLYDSLDNGSTLVIYGQNVEEHITFIGEMTALLGRGKTLTRKRVREAVVEFNERRYFISKDGFILDRHESFERLFLRLQLLVETYTKVANAPKPSMTDSHNLAIVETVLSESLTLVKSLHFKANGIRD